MKGVIANSFKKSDGARRAALQAVERSLRAADPSRLVKNALRLEGGVLKVRGLHRVELGRRRIIVVGGGKASALMAAGVEDVLGARIDDGLVIVPEYQRPFPSLERVKLAKSTHPLPSPKGVRAVKNMLEVLDTAGKGDLVVALISGGGSALMTSPLDGVSIAEMQATTHLLLRAGAEIRELNCVRKHLSKIAGGRLAERAGDADLISLIISDVVGDDLSSIASGPTVPDPTTFSDARRALKSRGVWSKIPLQVRRKIDSGIEGSIRETPKPGDEIFRRVSNILIGSNEIARSAVKTSLRKAGYWVCSNPGSVTGEARLAGRRLAREAVAKKHRSDRWGLVWGGETTVTVHGDGLGGRNQELALAAAIALEGSRGITLVSFGTDGVDGPTSAAGAIADSTTAQRAKAAGIDPRRHLLANDSFSFFKALGDLVVTGPTGTNVNDVMFAIGERG